jgi:hypothetical protein
MTAYALSVVVLVCVFGGALFGLYLRKVLPEHHLSADTKDVVKVVAGLIATLAALVLGLLVASAKSSFDTTNEGFRKSAARVIILDRALAQYGPETKGVRDVLKATFTARADQLSTRDRSASVALKSADATAATEELAHRIRTLAPKDDAQRALQSQALALANEISEARWISIENEDNSIPAPFLVIMVFWLSAMFASFGMFAPRNAVSVFVLFLGALSLAAAIFLIEELYTPLEGLITISRTPLETARAQLGR